MIENMHKSLPKMAKKVDHKSCNCGSNQSIIVNIGKIRYFLRKDLAHFNVKILDFTIKDNFLDRKQNMGQTKSSDHNAYIFEFLLFNFNIIET